MAATEAESTALWEELVLSILAVNGYSIEKVYCLNEPLRAEGLLDPANLSHWSPGDIGERLHRAGYNRGQFMTALLALRLSSLGVFLESKGLQAYASVLRRGDPTEMARLLLPIPGIGPKVLASFFLLRGITAPVPIPSVAKQS